MSQHEGDLDAELQQASDDGAPCERGRELRAAHAHAENHQRRDHRRAPEHRRDVGDEELSMRVENPERPRVHHQEPDAGATRRVKILSQLLDNREYEIVKKNRNLNTGEVESVYLEDSDGTESSKSDLRGKRGIIVDDMITSGATVIKAAELLNKKGIEEIIVFATHGIFASGASQSLQDSNIKKIYVTDTVFIPEVKKVPKMEILSISEIVAKELKNLA